MSDETTQATETDRPVDTQTHQPTTEPAASPDRVALQAELETRLRAELSEINAIAAQAARLGVTIDPVKAHAEGLSPADLRKQVLDKAAAADQARDIQANTPHPDSGATRESPLVAATQKLINKP